MRANVSGCEIDSGPCGGESGRGSSPLQIRLALPANMARSCVVVEARDPGRAQREQERAGLLAVGVVRGVEHLLRRDEPEEVEEIERAPDRRVEEDARAAREAARECGEVGDAAVGDDQLRVVALDEVGQLVGDRRQAAAAVDQDRDLAVGRELEHRREPLVVQMELLGARVQLDSARAGIEAARRLSDRILVQVEADERDEPPVGARCKGERPVVRGAEGRVAVGLVEAEHERPGDPVPLLAGDQLVEVADPPVDVGAEMDVGVEDLEVLRKLVADQLLEALDERLRPQKDVLHGP